MNSEQATRASALVANCRRSGSSHSSVTKKLLHIALSKHSPSDDEDACKWRHLVENYFAKIKEFRFIATRYDKTDNSYAASWNLVATLIVL